MIRKEIKQLMASMRGYYISRALLSIIFGLLIFFLSSSIWIGLGTAIIVFFTFFFLSRSGRYKVSPEKGIAALQRDEWTQGISNKSGRNAWVVVAIAGSVLTFYFGIFSPDDVPVGFIGGLILLGFITYYVSDYWLRRL